MSALSAILENFRRTALTEREKGQYFERLVKVYLTQEPYYADLYGGQVWLWEEWRKKRVDCGRTDPGIDAGIDLVAETPDGEIHAIQAKFYADDTKLYLNTLGTFFTASGKAHFTRRLIVYTAADRSPRVQSAIEDQNPPVNLISLHDLENSKIDWTAYQPDTGKVALKATKELRPYQEQAIENVTAGLQAADRGKLIMACGTGKTFTALRLAERVAGRGGMALFLVPSLNLLSQTLTEWTQGAALPLHSFAVCSDSEVGKKRAEDGDFGLMAHELQYPATTDARILAKAVHNRRDERHLSVVFSTYHSIEVIAKAQRDHGLPAFDIILCDEAHRTTGAVLKNTDDPAAAKSSGRKSGEIDESAFVKIHNNDFIKGRKRVYMTATPRVYGTAAKVKAETDSIVLYSMDDEKLYGKTLHTLSFSEAVNDLKILCDYKVIVLTIEETHVSKSLQRLLASADNSINVNDAAKIVGCWRGLAKMDSQDDLAFDPAPMRRAVAFAQVIEPQEGRRSHKVSSKNVAKMFAAVIEEYRRELLKDNLDHKDGISHLHCEAEHVDGGMGAVEKNQKLDWLKAPAPPDTCRILSNVRCLSEGVDVPALDAVLFLTPRNSQVDVVQSVGRVMRKPHGGEKKLGYVILPVVIPADKTPDEALNDNQSYRVVWEVLQALRSHDDRFDAMVNRLHFDGQDRARMEVIAISDKVPPRRSGDAGRQGDNGKASAAKRTHALGTIAKDSETPQQLPLEFEIGDIERAILAKVVKKCGSRLYWDEWARDIAGIASTHVTRLTAILDDPRNTEEQAAFATFLADLRADLNNSITRDAAIEMLAQHLITRPVFDAMFQDYSFAEHNPVSEAMQSVLAALERHRLEKETDTLKRLYDSVKRRAADTQTVAGKQKLIVELYDKFFRNAFPKMAERLGIVYTPVEVVDFIIHSVNDVLQSEFGQTLGSRNVHILDPFTGTGTFITRLLQSGLITPEEMPHKYAHEIHANEIVLLAYYIAAINIEQVYHSLVGGKYVPFDGICLTDTFNLPTGKSDLDSRAARDNSARLKRQRNLDIRVIFGNPPYSAGQSSANDNNQNLAYASLDQRIRETYAAHSKATNQNSLYDSYIRAIRWASDRIGNSGVIGFVSNAGWIEGNAAGGLRKCLTEEFSNLHIFHLRGNARTSGELRRKEKDNVFGQGTRTPIVVYIFVKNPIAEEHGKIMFHEIGDYLTREEKLNRIAEFGSIAGIASANSWQVIIPDAHHDWLKQRKVGFNDFARLGDKKKESGFALFKIYSNGAKTNRDAWVYNFSLRKLECNVQRSIDFYNHELDRYKTYKTDIPMSIEGFVNQDSQNISWSRAFRNDILHGKRKVFIKDNIVYSMYRPFNKQYIYFFPDMINDPAQMFNIYPTRLTNNIVIVTAAPSLRLPFSVQIVDCISDLGFSRDGTQCFPRWLYEPVKSMQSSNVENAQAHLFVADNFNGGEDASRYQRRDAITEAGLAHFAAAYPGEIITKDDLFYYVYGLLHSEEYRTRYADNLSKELPRIPAVQPAAAFQAFAEAGRKLAELHLGYETATSYPVAFTFAKPRETFTPEDWRVTQMKFAKGSNGVKHDKTTVVYNHNITLRDIPLEAYDYVVNGKPALEWVMERQAVTTHKESGIVNDANDWANETMHNPAYPMELFQRVITVSLETMKIVRSLPPLGDLAAL